MGKGTGLYVRSVAARASPEDLLTEFLAAALRSSSEFAAAFVDVALARFAAERGWANVVLTDVKTQWTIPSVGTPDMTVTLRDDYGALHVVAAEHKIRAVETVRFEPAPSGGPTEEATTSSLEERDDRRRVGQLERYLGAADLDAVLYIRENRAPLLPKAVIDHPKYVRARLPTNDYDHFIWSDFYAAVADTSDSHEHVGWLREGFIELHHYTPVHPFVGELGTVEKREEFKKYWRLAYESAQRMGWQPTYDDHWGLFMWKNPASLAETIGLKPLSGRFRIRVLAATDADIHDVESRCATAVAPLGIDLEWQMKPTIRKNKDGAFEKIDVLDGWADLPPVLGPHSDGDAIISRLDQIVRRLSESLRRT